MLRGKLLAAWRGAVVVMFLLSLCTAGQAVSPPPASAQPCTVGCPSLASTFNNYGITASPNTTPPDWVSDNLHQGGGFDGNGATFSQTQLIAKGAAPGALIVSSGVTFTFPNVAAGTLDNTVMAGQTIKMSGSGTLGFLLSASYGPGTATGAGIITYTDATTSNYTLPSIPDWLDTTPPSGGQRPITTDYHNAAHDTTEQRTSSIFSVTVPLTPGKTVASVTLPPAVPPAQPGWPSAVHIFAIATASRATLLSQGKHATESSVEDPRWVGQWAVDGDLTSPFSRWSSAFSDPQWLQVDLGSVDTISQVVLVWQGAYATAFRIETSMDGSNWTTIYSTTTGTGGTQSLDVTGSGRYVRMYGTARATAYGYSLYEFQVYGTAPTAAPSPGVSVGYAHACAIIAGKVYCWGTNGSGELGTGSPAPVYESTAVQAAALSPAPAQVSAGNHYTCALGTPNAAYCWGRNLNGEVGRPTSENPVLTPTAVSGNYRQVSASYNGNHTCALGTSAQAYCWGRNDYGQLANTSAGGPAPAAVTVATGTPTFTMVSAGTDHTCAVATTGYAYCWGRNTDGQLGCSATINPTCPSTSINVPVAVDTSGPLRDKTMTQISAGDTHTCALDSDGHAYCWGNNDDGQLGCGTTDINPACGASSSVPVEVLTPPQTRWAQITAGSDFTCALTTFGKAWCWGYGASGQVGNHANEVSTPSPVEVATSPSEPSSALPEDAFLTQISSGYASTCVMDTESNVYCGAWAPTVSSATETSAAATCRSR